MGVYVVVRGPVQFSQRMGIDKTRSDEAGCTLPGVELKAGASAEKAPQLQRAPGAVRRVSRSRGTARSPVMGAPGEVDWMAGAGGGTWPVTAAPSGREPADEVSLPPWPSVIGESSLFAELTAGGLIALASSTSGMGCLQRVLARPPIGGGAVACVPSLW